MINNRKRSSLGVNGGMKRAMQKSLGLKMLSFVKSLETRKTVGLPAPIETDPDLEATPQSKLYRTLETKGNFIDNLSIESESKGHVTSDSPQPRTKPNTLSRSNS